MKNNNILTVLFILSIAFVTNVMAQEATNTSLKGAIQEEDWTFNWVNYKPNKVPYQQAEVELSGVIDQDVSLFNTNTYLIKGNVYVTNGATLRIFPGTVIKGDSETNGTLIVTKGAKLIAQGTSTDPVVFTSSKSVGGRESGDWGGIIILGDSPINKIGGVSKLEGDFDHTKMIYGGENRDDNSGVLKYVRIEFAGQHSKKNDFGALTMAGVGYNTQISNVQVSNSDDDGFKFIGGAVRPVNIVSYLSMDDDFDVVQGYDGMLKNIIAVRHPLVSDYSGSRSISVEGYDKGNTYDTEAPKTKLIVSNATLIKLESTGLVSSPADAIEYVNEPSVKFTNSLLIGFDRAFIMNDLAALKSIQSGNIELDNSYVSSGVLFESGDNSAVVYDWFNASKFKNKLNKVSNIAVDLSFFKNATSKGRLDFRIVAESTKIIVGVPE